MTTSDDNPWLALARFTSGLQAASEAVQHASLTGIGIIRRKEDGTYESVDPSKFVVTIAEDAVEQSIDINNVDHYILYFDQTITAKAYHSTCDAMPSSRDMQSADVTVVVLKDGSKRILKNRLGPLDDERWLR